MSMSSPPVGNNAPMRYVSQPPWSALFLLINLNNQDINKFLCDFQGEFTTSCTDEKICQCDNVSFKEGVKKCVNVSGTLFVGVGAQQVEFKETETCTISLSAVSPPQRKCFYFLFFIGGVGQRRVVLGSTKLRN